MDLKSILTNFPWVTPNTEKTSYNFFRERDIRKVNSYEWKLLLNRHLGMNNYKPFHYIHEEYFYAVPYFSTNTLKIEHVIALTEDFKPLREIGKDPFPYGMISVFKSNKVYVLSNWGDYIFFFKKNNIPEKSAIILDKYTLTYVPHALDEQPFWINELRKKELVLVESDNKADTKETIEILDHLQLPYSLEQTKVVHQEIKKEQTKVVQQEIKKEIVTPLSPEERFMPLSDLSIFLKDKGINATHDMIRKIPVLVDIPCKIHKETNKKLYSNRFFELYFKYKSSGLTRTDSAEKALEEYKKA